MVLVWLPVVRTLLVCSTVYSTAHEQSTVYSTELGAVLCVHGTATSSQGILLSFVAAVVMQVEATQSMIRIVGLSATLPNYQEVTRTLRHDLDRYTRSSSEPSFWNLNPSLQCGRGERELEGDGWGVERKTASTQWLGPCPA